MHRLKFSWLKFSWIESPRFDLIFVLGPSWILLAILWLSSSTVQYLATGPILVWLFLAVGLDSSHQYATLFRTYFRPKEIAAKPLQYVLMPVLVLTFGMLMLPTHSDIYWRLVVYLAIFHFIRQQYGIMALYSRMAAQSKVDRLIDRLAIYAATIYPLLYEHSHLPRHYDWSNSHLLVPITITAGQSQSILAIYILCLFLFVGKELRNAIVGSRSEVPRILHVLGTAVVWYVGLVVFDIGLVFYAAVLIGHAIPYHALIWKYHVRVLAKHQRIANYHSQLIQVGLIFAFLGVTISLAFLETSVWKALEQIESSGENVVFHWLTPLQPLLMSHAGMIKPWLALPQIMHYILDGFIWKSKSL